VESLFAVVSRGGAEELRGAEDCNSNRNSISRGGAEHAENCELPSHAESAEARRTQTAENLGRRPRLRPQLDVT
jgi:hypothetical protein